MVKESICKPEYRILNQEQINQIHEATLSLLEKTGVKVENERGRHLLSDAGCSLKDNNIVTIPRDLIEQCIKTCPSSIQIYDRNGELAMDLSGRNNYFGLGTDLIDTIDIDTGKRRRSELQDVRNAAVVADACENVDFIASFALPSDVDTNTMYIECFKAEVENSTKPIFFTSAGSEDLKIIIKMASEIAGNEKKLSERPFIIHYSEPTAPLMHSFGAVNKVIMCAEKNIPICYVPGVLMGASGPVTLAGGVIQANAECLSGIVLHQLANEGAPIISGWAVVPLDMRDATYCYGSPELRITNTVFADLYHHYEIPMWSIVGTDSHCLDQQASMEHTFSTLMAALDGANLIHDIGYLGQGLLGNPASIVMCDEIISYIKRILRGFRISDETLALDIIDKVGPGGDFFTQRHTLKHFRKEHWQPKLINRKNPDGWKASGSPTYGEKLIEKTKEILKNHETSEVSEQVRKKLEIIVQEAEKRFQDKEFAS